MPENASSLLRRALQIADELIDADRVATARRRQADMLAWRTSDYVPLVFGRHVAALDGLEEFDWAQQYADPAASLYMQLRGVIPAVASGSDYVPSVRADTGVVNGPSILGAPWAVPAHTKPVVTAHVPRERLAAFEVPDDIRSLGCMPTMVKHTTHHLAALAEAGLDERIGVRHCDTQGPFDIAAQAYGHDEIFLDLYEDPEFVEELLEKSAQIYVAMSRLSKDLAGDGYRAGLANEYWMDPGSVRLCDDSGILVSPELYRRSLAPFLQKAMEPFGGGWLHYCGGVPDGNRPEGLHLHEIYCRTPALRGLNFTTGGDWPGEVRRLIERRVAYLGTLPREDGESLEAYFRRVLSLCDGRRGMIFHPQLRAGESDAALETWQRLQDEML